MKKLILITLFFTSSLFSQTRPHMLFVIGNAQKGGITLGLDFKNIYRNFGFYFNTRGLNSSMDYESGIDYSSIASVVILSEEVTNLNPYGMTFGLNYGIKNTGFSIKAGVGFATTPVENYTRYKYDFMFIEDEYNSVRFLEREIKKTSYEALLDYDFFYKKNYCLGLQAGYNNIHKSIIQFYIGTRL